MSTVFQALAIRHRPQTRELRRDAAGGAFPSPMLSVYTNARFVREVVSPSNRPGELRENPVRSVPAMSPRAVSKTSPRAKPGNTRPSRAEARTRGGWPPVSAVGLDFPWVPERRPASASSTRAGGITSGSRGAPEGSLAQSRRRMTILRSTLGTPIDERRCRSGGAPHAPAGWPRARSCP